MAERRDRTGLWPSRVYVSRDASNDALTERVLSRLPNATVEYLDEGADPISETSRPDLGDTERFNLGKKGLLLTRHRGSWLKSCPGTSSHVCCNLWIVNPGEGCPLDCTYCYLQTYLRRNPTLKLYTNVDGMLDEIKTRAAAEPSRLFRVGTGELIDSLVWDELTDHTLDLVPFFARIPNAILELKSKDDSVDNLVSLKDEHNGKTVVSWSVNAKSISERDEAKTATLDQRIAAAARVADAGYRVGFHFDPLVHFAGWEDEYRDTIAKIFAQINPEQVAWVSISTLRYRPEMQRIMIERFPESSLPYGEQFLAKDNKLRYVQPLRLKMMSFVWNELKAVRDELPVYMCMESSVAWKTVAGGAPVAGAELVEIFSRRGKLEILGQGPAGNA